MKRRFFSAPTLQKAILAAASEYGLDPDVVAYQVIDKRHGFLKIRRNVVIEVDPEGPSVQGAAEVTNGSIGPPAPPEAGIQPYPPDADPFKPVEACGPPPADGAEVMEDWAKEIDGAEAAGATEATESPETEEDQAAEVQAPEAPEAKDEPQPESRAPRGKRPPAERRRRPSEPEAPEVPFSELPPATGKLAEAAEEAMESLLDLLDMDVDAEIRQGEDRFEINVTGPDEERLLTDSGRALRALEHLMPRAMRGVGGESYPCRVDSGDFQETHRRALEERARKVAAEVASGGEADFLDPMNPADRRVIHITLADHPEVATKSVGGGLFKRVKVYPR